MRAVRLSPFKPAPPVPTPGPASCFMWSLKTLNRSTCPRPSSPPPPSHDSSPTHFQVDWSALHHELTKSHSLLSYSLRGSSHHDYDHLSRNLFDSIIHAVYFLLHGFALNPQIHDHQRNPTLTVWSAAHEARSVIIDYLNDLPPLRRSSRLINLPVVVLITDTYPLSESLGANYYVPSKSTHNSNVHTDTNDPIITSWNSICKPRTQFYVVVPQSTQKLCSAVEAILEPSSHERSTCPALVVLYLSCDSFITSNLSALRAVCDSQHAHLCVDGPGTALLAQPNTPLDPQNCLQLSDIIIVDPSSWFGFDDCAVVVFQNDQSFVPTSRRHHISVRTSFPTIEPSQPQLDKFPQALIPFLKLWTVLSRVGSHTMRHMVDHATTLAESFVHLLHESKNLQATYEGVACVVRISYTLPRDDRLMAPHRARSMLSTINDAIFATLEQQATALGILRGEGEHGSFLHFSPARLLSWGSSTVPNVQDVRSFIYSLQDAADRYETCRVGSPVFSSHISKSPYVLSVDSQERSDDLILSHGCFRIVPVELQRSWRHTNDQLQKVEFLTSALAAELSNAATAAAISDFLPASLEASLSDQTVGCWIKTNDQQNAGGADNIANLPFAFFLHSEMPMGIPDFISVEPRIACPPVEAVRQAQLAGKLVVDAAQAVMCKWSDNNHIPYDLTPYGSAVESKEEESKHVGVSPEHPQDQKWTNNFNGQGVHQHTDESVISEGDDFHSATSGDIEVEGCTTPLNCNPGIQTSASNQYQTCFSSHSTDHQNDTDPFFQNFAVGDFGPLESPDENSDHLECSATLSDGIEPIQGIDGITQSEAECDNLNDVQKPSGGLHHQELSQNGSLCATKSTHQESSWLNFWTMKNPFFKSRHSTSDLAIGETSHCPGIEENKSGERGNRLFEDDSETEISGDTAHESGVHAGMAEGNSFPTREPETRFEEGSGDDSTNGVSEEKTSSSSGVDNDSNENFSLQERLLSSGSGEESTESSSDESGAQSQASVERRSSLSVSSSATHSLEDPSYAQTSIASTILNWFQIHKTLPSDLNVGSRSGENESKNGEAKASEIAAPTTSTKQAATRDVTRGRHVANVKEVNLEDKLCRERTENARSPATRTSLQNSNRTKSNSSGKSTIAAPVSQKECMGDRSKECFQGQENMKRDREEEGLITNSTNDSLVHDSSEEEDIFVAEKDYSPGNEGLISSDESWGVTKLWKWLGLKKHKQGTSDGKSLSGSEAGNDPLLNCSVEYKHEVSFNDADQARAENLSDGSISSAISSSIEAQEITNVECDEWSEDGQSDHQKLQDRRQTKSRVFVGPQSSPPYESGRRTDRYLQDELEEQESVRTESSVEGSCSQVCSDAKTFSNSSGCSQSHNLSLVDDSEQDGTEDSFSHGNDSGLSLTGSIDRLSGGSSISKDSDETFDYDLEEERSSTRLSSCSGTGSPGVVSDSDTYESDNSYISRSDTTSEYEEQDAVQVQADKLEVKTDRYEGSIDSIDSRPSRLRAEEERKPISRWMTQRRSSLGGTSGSIQSFSSTSEGDEDCTGSSTCEEEWSDDESGSTGTSESCESSSTLVEVTRRSKSRGKSNTVSKRRESNIARGHKGEGRRNPTASARGGSSLRTYFPWMAVWSREGR